MAALTPYGVLAYEVYQSDYKVTGAAIEQFIQQKVRNLIDFQQSMCILDNASNQSTAGVHGALTESFGVEYWYHFPAYSRASPLSNDCFR